MSFPEDESKWIDIAKGFGMKANNTWSHHLGIHFS
jgi:hypothetical protein